VALQLGKSAQARRSFTAGDVADYIALGGQRPSDDVVPEPLIGAMFSCLLGVKLPGLGTNYLKQESEFKVAAHIDEPLTARVEITRLRPEKHLVDLRTTCRNANGDLICTGRALVYVEDVRP
jgi:3-hydroxybutyryl-CoA dehydratase